MSTTQISACRPTISVRSRSVSQQKQLFGLKPFNLHIAPPPHRRLCIPVLKFKQSATVCFARSGSENEVMQSIILYRHAILVDFFFWVFNENGGIQF